VGTTNSYLTTGHEREAGEENIDHSEDLDGKDMLFDRIYV
jgi:hypothetical protein